MRPRHQRAPVIVYTARSDVPSNLYAAADAVLKDLKHFVRKLSAVSSDFLEELRILDRLFYKGNNQHRNALFWKRVCEVRRFGQRINDLNAHVHLHDLRCAFFGPEAATNAKLMKGTWNSFPNYEYAEYVFHRLAACQEISTKMQEALRRAYSYFALAMQSGAFIQLTVVLTAIVSRMSILISDIHEVSRSSWMSVHRLLEVLDPDRTRRIAAEITPLARSSSFSNSRIINPAETQLDTSISEDLGARLARCQHPVLADSLTGRQKGDESSSSTPALSLNIAPSAAAPPFVVRKAVKTVRREPSKIKRGGALNVGSSSQAFKKKKPPRDEIDDIFG